MTRGERPGRSRRPMNRRQFRAELDELTAFCTCCDHSAEWHRHYRRGSDCGACRCPRYRPPRLVNDSFPGGLRAWFSPAATQPGWAAGKRGPLWNWLHGKGWRIT